MLFTWSCFWSNSWNNQQPSLLSPCLIKILTGKLNMQYLYTDLADSLLEQNKNRVMFNSLRGDCNVNGQKKKISRPNYQTSRNFLGYTFHGGNVVCAPIHFFFFTSAHFHLGDR